MSERISKTCWTQTRDKFERTADGEDKLLDGEIELREMRGIYVQQGSKTSESTEVERGDEVKGRERKGGGGVGRNVSQFSPCR